MIFWASSESFEKADKYLERTRLSVEPYLNKLLNDHGFGDIELTIRFVPIVMPYEFHSKYKERSRIYIKKNIYDLSPHLHFDVFIVDDYESQINEYIDGIKKCIPNLEKFAIQNLDIEQFDRTIEIARRNLIQNQQV